jgi:hypothetical protein
MADYDDDDLIDRHTHKSLSVYRSLGSTRSLSLSL